MSRGPRAGSSAHERFEERASQLAGARRNRVLAVLLGVALLVGLGWLVLVSPVLAVREVSVVGADPADTSAVERAAAPAIGRPVARVDTDGIGDAVRRIPGVESVKVERDWPRGITVDVLARTPALAVEKSQGRVEVYDLDGVLVRTVRSSPKGVPMVTAEEGVTLTADGVAAARSMLEALPADLRSRVRSVSVDAADHVRFRAGGTTVVWGDASDAQLKVDVISVLLPKKPRTLDVSAPDTPVTR